MPKKLVNRTAPLKGAKKDVPPVSKAPYMVVHKYGEPTYHASHKEAISHIQKDLTSLAESWELLLADDAVTATKAAMARVEAELGVDGGHVRALVDPYTGQHFDVTLTLRKEPW